MGKKRILFIGIGFRDYEIDIRKRLEQNGYDVDYFSSVSYTRMNSLLSRFGIGRIAGYIRSKVLTKRIKSHIREYDAVFIIKGELFEQHHVNLLKQIHKCKIILYFWDSVRRMDNAQMLIASFSNIYTFDRLDACKYGLKFRPLYYRETLPVTNNFEYDLFFTGYYHSDRLVMIKKIKEECIKRGLRFKGVVVTGYMQYIIDRFIRKSINNSDKELISYRPISYNQYMELNRMSKCILDIAHPNQDGLTMRTLEAVGFNRLLLTTNKDIENYSNIDKKMYSVFDREVMDIDFEFIKNTSPCYYTDEYYSINTFIKTLIIDNLDNRLRSNE